MLVRRNGEPHQLYTRDPNAPFMNGSGAAACRLPSGHPEAFFEAFANVYRSAYDAMIQRASGETFDTKDTVYPNVHDGVEVVEGGQEALARPRALRAHQRASLGCLRSGGGKTSLSSAMATGGRSLVKSRNQKPNQAKLPTMMPISVRDGR